MLFPVVKHAEAARTERSVERNTRRSRGGYLSLLTLLSRELRRLVCLETLIRIFCCYLPAPVFRNFTFN